MSQIKSGLKLLFRVAKYFVIITTILILLLIPPFTRNTLGNYLIAKYASYAGVEFSCANLQITSNAIIIKNGKFKHIHDEIQTQNINIAYSITDLIFRRKTEYSMKVDDLKINDGIDFEVESHGIYNSRLSFVDALIETKSKYIKENHAGVDTVSLRTQLRSSKKSLDFSDLKFSINNGYLNLQAKIRIQNNIINNIAIKGDAKNLPIRLYEIFLSQENPVYQFFDYSISSGNLTSGDFKIQVPANLIRIAKKDFKLFASKVTEENFSGDFVIENVSYTYDKAAPYAFSKMLPIKLRGKEISIDIKEAVIAENKVTEGFVHFDYLSQNILYIIEAKTKGKASGLTEFIDQKTLEEMKNFGIDLASSTGIAESDVDIKVTGNPKDPMFFDIKSKVSKFEMGIFNNIAKIKNYTLDGKFNGKKIELKGSGLLDNFQSNIDVYVNLFEENDKICSLQSKIFLKNNELSEMPIKFEDGSSILKISYDLDKNMKSNIHASADLTKIHFRIPTIALDKKTEKRASFVLSSKDNNLDDVHLFKYKLSGEDDLLISGKFSTSKHTNIMSFDNVKYLNNDFKAELAFTDSSNSIKIHGKMLDLSEEDLSKFFNQKNEHQNKVMLNISLDKIKLKNKVTFTDTLIDLECKESRCSSAKLFSSIDQKNYLRLEYIDDQENPNYNIETNEAGKFFSSLGITNKIRGGFLRAKIDTEANASNNQLKGKFVMTKFDTLKNKFITKMVSFISVPGLLGAITNNNVPFDFIKGDIIIENDQWRFRDVSANGPYFNFFAKADINLTNSTAYIRGGVIPSLYGLNYLVGSVPVIKYFLGNKGAVVVTPFYFDEKY
ncbi:MAG: DUF3971 domain-containing protein [Rickettsiaceae bacterium]|nr:DUF3971 domain-containing protein [Rickettsiaceae bacterium]